MIQTQPASAWLTLTLLSDATFGRGDGVVSVVDTEVQHDEYGLPFLSGRTLKGLLDAECAEILHALRQTGLPTTEWETTARQLFGTPGSRNEAGQMRVGPAMLPEDLRYALMSEFIPISALPKAEHRRGQWGRLRQRNLTALTAIRRQTAMDQATGAPLKNTLRSMRVILRETPFAARLEFDQGLTSSARALLAACVKSFHRAGTGRNRGRGLVRADLYDGNPYPSVAPVVAAQSVLEPWFSEFKQEVQRGSAHLSPSSD